MRVLQSVGNLRGASSELQGGKLRGKVRVFSARYWIMSEAESARRVNHVTTSSSNMSA